jgi:ribulose-5-phosphate 4-epimerase/fuculose-1-phosphate aldolase
MGTIISMLSWRGLVVAGAVTAALSGAAQPSSAAAAAGTIMTVAGGVGGPGLATTVAMGPTGVSFYNGRIYVSDGVVQAVGVTTGRLTTAAGGLSAYNLPSLGDGGPALDATMDAWASVVDPAGNLVIADDANSRIRVAAAKTGTFYGVKMTAGDIYTIAGTGQAGFSGDGGPALKAELDNPEGLAVDASGNLVISDTSNDRVRVLAVKTGTFYGKQMTANRIYTVAGDGHVGALGDGGPATKGELEPRGLAVDASGNLVIADVADARVRVAAAATGTFYGQKMTAGDIYTVAGGGTSGVAGNGGPATKAWLLPENVIFDSAGNLVVTDAGNSQVRVVAAKAGTFYGQPMKARDIYSVAGNGTEGFAGDGGPATAAELDFPGGLTADTSGNLVVADTNNDRVRVVAAKAGTFYGQPMTAGDIYTVAGTGALFYSGDAGAAAAAIFNAPGQVTVDGAGNVVISDFGNSRVRVRAARTAKFYGVPMTAGDVYTVIGDGTFGNSGDGGPATQAEIGSPGGTAVDGNGNLLLADTDNNQIQLLAAKPGTFYGQKMKAGDLYDVAGNGDGGFTGDGGPATAAELDFPSSLAMDAAGNLVLADSDNHRIRVVAAATGTFYGQPMTAGDIYTVAGDGTSGFSGDGGPALKAELGSPGGVTVDGAGNLVLADTDNNRVRVVAAKSGTFYGQKMKARDIYTVAGGGTAGLGDGGPATQAELGAPEAVAVDAAGNLIIADTGDSRVRVVAAKSGTYYGVAMTAGGIYTVAGDGVTGFSGDGGPGLDAELYSPSGVAVSSAGNLYISDAGTNRIRTVSG